MKSKIKFRDYCEAYRIYIIQYKEFDVPFYYVTENDMKLGNWYIGLQNRIKMGSISDKELMELVESGYKGKVLFWDDWAKLLNMYFIQNGTNIIRENAKLQD